MHWYQTIVEVIDLRSFSNLWFWIALAVMWSTASHWVLGVPWDMVMRARRKGGSLQRDVEDLARIYVNRMLYIGRVAGTLLLGLTSFGLAMLAVLGFWYDLQFFQALFLLGFPMAFVGALSLRTASLIDAGDNNGDALYRRLRRHRISVQAIGVVAIFVTAMWGMWQNMTGSVLGG